MTAVLEQVREARPLDGWEPLPTTALRDIVAVPYREAFLIGELLPNKITFVTGEPKVGKSLYVVGKTLALLDKERDEFLGFPIHRHIERVLWAVTDDGAEEELRARMDGALPGIGDAVRVLVVADHRGEGFWERARETIKSTQADLFVLDHVLGALDAGDDIASSVTASKIVSNLRTLSLTGVPIIAVTHTPKGSSEGLTVASSVIGGRAGAAGGRGVVALRSSQKRGGLYIQTTINRARKDHDFKVLVHPAAEGSEVPVWVRRDSAVKTGQRSHKRDDERVQKLHDMANWLVAEQPSEPSFKQLAESRYHEKFGLKVNDVRRKLSAHVHYDKETRRWVLGLAPTAGDDG